MKDRIERLIEMTLNTCLPWITEKDGKVMFTDPLDNEEISAHYGATHMAAALLIYGRLKDRDDLVQKGEALLNSILDRWDGSRQLPGFHNDFNNFALCLIENSIDGNMAATTAGSAGNTLRERIRKAVLETADTRFDTVNWLPMRWFVNKCRYEWTNDETYKENCRLCKEKIDSATFTDGFIDDMLPKGRSFSLQYNVATVAFMQFLRISGENIDLDIQTGALLNAVCPDGDINYMGRGTNQIFAWGLWVYLLASSGQDECDRALSYLEERLPAMLENNNIFLNTQPGDEKYLWWDYHYCSVYTAHLLLWLTLAWRDYGERIIDPETVTDGSSGLHIYRNEEAFVAVFDGRTEYFAERGPSVEAVWTRKYGTVFKGAFGPWYGEFGNLHICPDAVIRKHFGLMGIKTDDDKKAKNKVMQKLRLASQEEAAEEVKPVFTAPQVKITDKIKITYQTEGLPVTVNIPDMSGMVTAYSGGQELKLTDALKIRDQYGWITVRQQILRSGKTVEIEVPWE